MYGLGIGGSCLRPGFSGVVDIGVFPARGDFGACRVGEFGRGWSLIIIPNSLMILKLLMLTSWLTS